MFRRKMSEQELRMWCAEQISRHYCPSPIMIDELYEYITKGESKATQKKPRECFASRLSSWIRGLLKRP